MGDSSKTLARYFYNPHYFVSLTGTRRILADDDEEEVVRCILSQHVACMALTHIQFKWLPIEIVKRVGRKAHMRTGRSWIANDKLDYSWYRKFFHRHSDKIRSRVVENLDPKRWKISFTDVESLYTIMDDLHKKYTNIPTKNIANLDETNLTPERRKSPVLTSKGARRTNTLYM